ncbi:MAG: endonuclease/exonuclease/phosphatase family protein [Polyangiaceae bacterium]|nr:endonuclease/exonuclease/phosphatase family protein [Polyangiaceae bacterium]
MSTLTVVLALGYTAALLGIIVGFRFVGERWWVTVVAMYLPRVGFAIPLPVVVLAAVLWAPRWVLATQALSVYLLLFPLMGLNLGFGRVWTETGGLEIRLASYNVHYNARTLDSMVAEVRSYEPSVVLMQEAYAGLNMKLRAAFAGWHVHLHDQFFVASRWPIRDVYLPPNLVYPKRGTGGPHYVRYTLETSLGLVDVFNVHPTSPREGFEELRGGGFRYELQSGRAFAGNGPSLVKFNTLRRRRQVEGLAAAARASRRPVIIAGDTNLPGLSWLLNARLGGYRDGFSSVGWGFGYTYPTKRPWLRLDRVMTNDRLRVTDFRIGSGRASDHLCVFAAIAAER